MQFEFQFPSQHFERVKQLVCALIRFFAIFPQRFANDLLKLCRSVCDVTREERWFLLKNRSHYPSWRFAGEWRMPRYHFVKDYAETPDIGTLINRDAARLFRRHVTNGSQYRPKICRSECHRSCPVRRSLGKGGFGELCNPEVEHFHVPIRPEHDVLRLDVAMDNAGFVGGSERSRHLNRDVNSFTQLHSPAHETLAQCLAFDQFTGYVVN